MKNILRSVLAISVAILLLANMSFAEKTGSPFVKGFGKLSVKSTDANDRIFVDDIYKGNQSVIILKEPAGEHVVKVKRGNNIVYHEIVNVVRDQQRTIVVEKPVLENIISEPAVEKSKVENQIAPVVSLPAPVVSDKDTKLQLLKQRNPVWGILTDTPYNLNQGEGNFGAGTILYVPYLANVDYGLTDRLQVGVDGWIFSGGIGGYVKYNVIKEDSVWPQLTVGYSQYGRLNFDRNNATNKTFFSSSISDVSVILGKKTTDNMWLYCGGKSVVQLIGDPVTDRNDIVGAKVGAVFDIGESNDTIRRAMFEIYYKWFTLSDYAMSGLAGGMSWEKDKDITTIGLMFPVLLDRNNITVLSVPVPFINFQWRF